MEMRPTLRLLFLLFGTACGLGTPSRTGGPYDLILKGGWIIDGSGNPRYAGDVAITGDRIAAVGYLGGAQARDTIRSEEHTSELQSLAYLVCRLLLEKKKKKKKHRDTMKT